VAGDQDYIFVDQTGIGEADFQDAARDLADLIRGVSAWVTRAALNL
jgi:hypothetical protein